MSENKINGGSYRIYCKKNIKKSIKYKEQASYSEIIKFIKRVKNNKKRTVKFIRENVKLGKKYFFICINKRKYSLTILWPYK